MSAPENIFYSLQYYPRLQCQPNWVAGNFLVNHSLIFLNVWHEIIKTFVQSQLVGVQGSPRLAGTLPHLF